MSKNNYMVPNIKSIPFTPRTLLIGFVMLVLAGILGYLFAFDEIQSRVQIPEIFVQTPSSGDLPTSMFVHDGCSIATLSNNHNSSPLPNGDARFACYDGTYYFCSNNSENKWVDKGVIQVQYGDRRGDFVCVDDWVFEIAAQPETVVSEESNLGDYDPAPVLDNEVPSVQGAQDDTASESK